LKQVEAFPEVRQVPKYRHSLIISKRSYQARSAERGRSLPRLKSADYDSYTSKHIDQKEKENSVEVNFLVEKKTRQTKQKTCVQKLCPNLCGASPKFTTIFFFS
jgi:hypothetical protein